MKTTSATRPASYGRSITVSFAEGKRKSASPRHDMLITFMSHTRSLQARPAPVRKSVLRTFMSLFF